MGGGFMVAARSSPRSLSQSFPKGLKGAVSMAITAVCTSCGKKFQAPDQFAGKRVKCKGCGAVFLIPGPTAAARAGESAAGRSSSKTHVDPNAASRAEVDYAA